jgi:tRNA threonylcarbamoyladenosine biosynthesis protein TsaB
MRVVGLDTASEMASVALVENGLLIAERTYPDPKATGGVNTRTTRGQHAEVLLPLIASLFATTTVAPQDITGFAVSIGPGSFTGLRIGLSTVKGLAYSTGVPVVGVSTLFGHAARVKDYDGLICPILDARKNQIYAALFRKLGESMVRLTQDSLTSVATVIEIINQLENGASCLFVGDGVAVHERLLLQGLGNRVLFETPHSDSTVAASVAQLSENRFRSNDVDDLASLIPVYLRPAEAEFKRLTEAEVGQSHVDKKTTVR